MKRIIREIMQKKGYTNESLAQKCGYSTPSGVSNIICRDGGMRVDNLFKLLDAMDCEIIIRDNVGYGEEWVVSFDIEDE